ncbi:hypothetical protein DPMN_009468 [Dreissena polymorpha]|uniref:Uncharacterized protein n=1 Tax=Dreissena polymorpha TaxID=45954 RepID=A0A9D4N193_DREPO|nr:hypothetical protein DPMN_009468 [Dreissena polymorpha]
MLTVLKPRNGQLTGHWSTLWSLHPRRGRSGGLNNSVGAEHLVLRSDNRSGGNLVASNARLRSTL